MEWFDEELPDFGHGFERAAAQGIGVHRDGAPTDDAKTLGVRSRLNGRAGIVKHGGRKKGEADREHFGQLNALLLGTGAEERLGKRSEQTSAVATSPIGVNATAVSEAL